MLTSNCRAARACPSRFRKRRLRGFDGRVQRVEPLIGKGESLREDVTGSVLTNYRLANDDDALWRSSVVNKHALLRVIGPLPFHGRDPTALLVNG